MATSKTERPLASSEYECDAHELFPITMSPEEYVARFGPSWLCCSFPSHSYRDKALDEWLQRFDELMATPGIVDKLREQFFTPREIEELRRQDELSWYLRL